MQLYYFISADGRRLGPVPGEELVNCGITPDTLVWGQNMSGWAPANTVPEIVALFTSQPQPTQPQSSENATEMPEPSSSTGNAPIQTENDIDSTSTPEQKTPESPASEPSNPSSEPDSENKKGRNVWRDILIIFAIILFFTGIISLINSNKSSSSTEVVDETEVIEPIVAVDVIGVSFNMIYVEGGTFTMGETSEQVTLSDYYIGETEVTQELWEAVMDNNPSYHTGNSRYPVEQVSWDDCQTFIHELNRLTGKQFRLPSEAEWEFAASGGNRSKGYKYSGSNRIDDVAWYSGNSSETTHSVGKKTPNELGIYDMSGNVLEWCSDLYDSYRRVYRGGNWGDLGDARRCRVSWRGMTPPSYGSNGIGFRLVCSSL